MLTDLRIREDVHIYHDYPIARPDELANNRWSNNSLTPWIGLGLGALALFGLFRLIKPKQNPNPKKRIEIETIFNLVLESFRNAETDLKDGKDPNEIRKGLEPLIDSIKELAQDFGRARMAIIFNFIKRLDGMIENHGD